MKFRVPVLLALLFIATSAAQSAPFIVFGDNRPYLSTFAQPKIFKDILKDAATLSPAFAVNTGDCIYGASSVGRLKEQYDDYKAAISSFPGKVYLAVGNHEIGGKKSHEDFFAKELGSLYYSFDYEGAHFIVLDTEVVGEEGRITGKQLAWLKQDLHASRAAKYKFVFMHRPMYPVGGHIGSSLDKYPDQRNALHWLFVQSHVSAVFTGHEHLFDHTVRNGVHYIITGGAGAGLYTSTKGEGDFHHYIAVDISGDKLSMKLVKFDPKREVVPITK